MTLSARSVSLLVLLMACHKPCPVAPRPEPIVSLTLGPKCNLPSLPDGPTITIGYPTPESVMVSKTDYAQMLVFVEGLRDWIYAASACMEAHDRTFAQSVGGFLNGAR